MRTASALLIAATAALVAASPAAAKRENPDAALARAVKGRVAGKAVDCVQLRNITSTRIIAGKAILYQVGSTLYVNEPTTGANSLRSDDVLVTDTHSSQLCSIDTVRLIDRSAHFPRGFVGLGKFVPYRMKTANR